MSLLSILYFDHGSSTYKKKKPYKKVNCYEERGSETLKGDVDRGKAKGGLFTGLLGDCVTLS